MKSFFFKVGKYTSKKNTVPISLRNQVIIKWVPFFKKSSLFPIVFGESFEFCLMCGKDEIWHRQDIVIYDNRNPAKISLNGERGDIWFYHRGKKITEIIAHLNVSSKHKITCTVDDGYTIIRPLGRAQSCDTNIEDNIRNYVWSFKASRDSLNVYDWKPVSHDIDALISSRSLIKTRRISADDNDDFVNSNPGLPVFVENDKTIFMEFENHKYTPSRSVYAVFPYEDLCKTSGSITVRIEKTSMSVTMYYDRNKMTHIYKIFLVVPNYTKALNFKKMSGYNTK